LQVPGKNIRSKLARAFNYWLNIPEDKLQAIENIIEMMHNASLLYVAWLDSPDLTHCDAFHSSLDDIQDNSILRRGIPVAHSIYGVASTINAANYVLFIALEKVLELRHPEVCAKKATIFLNKNFLAGCSCLHWTSSRVAQGSRYGDLLEGQLYLPHWGRVQANDHSE
jgi:hypothetical protein